LSGKASGNEQEIIKVKRIIERKRMESNIRGEKVSKG